MMNKVEKIEVIRAEDLKPRDIILVTCKEEDQARVCLWADAFFKPYRVRVSPIFDTMKVQVLSACDDD